VIELLIFKTWDSDYRGSFYYDQTAESVDDLLGGGEIFDIVITIIRLCLEQEVILV